MAEFIFMGEPPPEKPKEQPRPAETKPPMAHPTMLSSLGKRKRGWFKKTILYALWRLPWDGPAPIADYIEGEWSAIIKTLKRAPGLCIGLVAVSAYLGWLWKGYEDGTDIARLQSSITELKGTTNYLAGVITEKGKSFEGLKSDYESFRQSNQDFLLGLNQDLNEAKRERDSAQQQAAFFASGPSNIFNLISAITNSLGTIESVVPRFGLFINGQVVTNGITLSIPTNRTIHILIDNISDLDAEGLTVQAWIPKGIALSRSGFISDGG